MNEDKFKKIIDNNYLYFGEYEYNEKTCIFEYDKKISVICNNKKIDLNIFVDNVDKYSVKSVVFKLNFKNDELDITNADKLIKSIKKFGRCIKKKNINIGVKYEEKVIIGNVINGKSQYEDNIISAIGVLLCENKYKRNEYLYDEICDYLDNIVIKNNVCGFEKNKCIAKRNTNCTMGCCHHYKNKRLGILFQKNLYLCEYQKDKRCTAKCITCKMYMCDYLRKRGYNYTCKNVLLIKNYFNIFQKIIIKTNYFTTKSEILKKINRFCI